MCRLCHPPAVSAHGDFKYRLDVQCHYQQASILPYVIAKGSAASGIDCAILPSKEQFQFYEQYDKRRGLDFRKAFPRLVEWYDSLKFTPLDKPEDDIQKPKGQRDIEVFAHREVDEDGVVEVKEVRQRTRKTGESQDDYDDSKYADEPDYKKKRAGSSIGWDPDADGLGGQ